MLKRLPLHIIMLVIFLSLPVVASAYDDEVTHPNITDRVVQNSNLDDFLKNQLSIDDGIKTYLNNNKKITILEWLMLGSIDEDDPDCRASNHFHNPLLSWKDSYLSDDISTTPDPYDLRKIIMEGIRVYCGETGWPASERKSNISWATGRYSPDGPTQGFVNQENGWHHAKLNYNRALTMEDKTDRDENLAKTFKALGHVIHLLEDTAQPAHVRNDFYSHIFKVDGNKEDLENGDYFEWVVSNVGSQYEHYVKVNRGLVTGVGVIKPDFSNTRLTDFWDTDKYNGTNRSESTTQGLAEFSNAYYFSDFTIPGNNPESYHSFPSPAPNSGNATLCVDKPVDSIIPFRKYVSRTSKGGCVGADLTPDNFAAVSLLNWPVYLINDDNIPDLRLYLDNKVYDTYARELLPRAIGYSAELIDYFFRGKIDMAADGSEYVIKNDSEEAMSGKFSLYYDADDDKRYEVDGSPWDKSIAAGDESDTVSFTPPTDAKEDGKYILVFNGTLGAESGAVAGKAVTLESEAFEVFDTFTDTPGTLLQNHTPDIGGAWVKFGGQRDIDIDDTGTALGNIDLGYPGGFYYNGIPDIANGYVEAFCRPSSHKECFLVWRWVDSSNYYYLWIHASGNYLTMYRVVGGVGIEIMTFYEKDVSQDKTTRVAFNGTNMDVYSNGVWKVSTTDSAHSTGKPGLGLFASRSSTKGAMDNFKADSTD